MGFSYPKYLAAKRTVDERARHPGVWSTFVDQLRERHSRTTRLRDLSRGKARSEEEGANGGSSSPVEGRERAKRLRLLEIGGGVGDLAIKVLETLRDLPLEYTLVDIERDNLALAEKRVRSIAPDVDVIPRYRQPDGPGSAPQRNRQTAACETDPCVYLVQEDVLDISLDLLCSVTGKDAVRPFDAVCGQAILDIVPPRMLLRKMHSIVADLGLVYLPIHFDGQTKIEPVLDLNLDRRVENIYHDSMKRRGKRPSGEIVSYDGSRSGRDLLMHGGRTGFHVEAAGASEWVVLPSSMRSQTGSGSTGSGQDASAYPEDEQYFLSCMLGFIEDELRASEEMSDRAYKRWSTTRRRQLEEGRLAMFVHNLDVLLRKPKTSR